MWWNWQTRCLEGAVGGKTRASSNLAIGTISDNLQPTKGGRETLAKMRDTTDTAEKSQTAGFDDRQGRVVAPASPVVERLLVRLDKINRLLKFIAAGVAVILIKGLTG